jgi:hypothetical protein
LPCFEITDLLPAKRLVEPGLDRLDLFFKEIDFHKITPFLLVFQMRKIVIPKDIGETR